LKEQGKPFVKEAAMAKLYSSQIAEKAASRCVEVRGLLKRFVWARLITISSVARRYRFHSRLPGREVLP
jgi:alkylation response protein AidB-like acyl-CoA dehydrogenase